MCLPLPFFQAAGNIVSGGLDFLAGRQRAKAANKTAAFNEYLALDTAAREYSAANARRAAEQEGASREIQRIGEEATRRIATVQSAAGASLVSGTSVGELVGEFQRTQADFEEATRRQEKFRDQALILERRGIVAREEANLRASNAQREQGPSLFGFLLNSAGSIVGAQAETQRLESTAEGSSTGSPFESIGALFGV